VYTGSLGRAFSTSLTASGKGLIAIGLRAVSCAVRAVFLVISGSEGAEGAPFSSYIALGSGVCLDLHIIIPEDNIPLHEIPTHSYECRYRSFKSNISSFL
jgi:hypothetical protein